ncbi:NAD(P)H-dependent oxidoreductase [Aggregatimonas sangjinii]|uniref:NAD(P)H-dependent oxidoreductase n=1 Tax=Aggregatimonas sangjinii TaxID=2583587 RepID=A0A5B7SSW9_9FLAO|nr:NAD(P)H-dependent oxidoreductase [Aggregatimonas sangjinii]QCX00419.1 NAD(P)H-dependent oxidoreductase [Aggregatimonas sangjinii]
MKKVVALGGSNSKNSINKALATYVAHQLKNVKVSVLDLNDFDIPLYGIDYEDEHGIPKDVNRLNDFLASADGLVVSLAEHNGSYSAAFKSAYDWLSRIDKRVWKDKPMLLMATSPGSRGGASVLQTARITFPRMGAKIVADFSLPSFNANFSEEGITDTELKAILKGKIRLLQEAIKND